MTRARTLSAGLLSAGVAVTLALAIRDRPRAGIDLAATVRNAIPDSGVEHDITAVLLQFRSYDTLLEIAVLLVAAVVALALRDEPSSRTVPPLETAEDEAINTPLLAALQRLLLPVMLVTAVYLLWAGAFQPGGAFQAGAVLAALGVLWRVAGSPLGVTISAAWRRGALVIGFAVFLAAGSAMLLLGRPLLNWPAEWAKIIIIAIEFVLMLSIAVSLLGLFASSPNAADQQP